MFSNKLHLLLFALCGNPEREIQWTKTNKTCKDENGRENQKDNGCQTCDLVCKIQANNY